MFIFNQFAFSFQGYLQYIGNKERENRFITPREQSVLEYYTKSYELINTISDGLAILPNTSETRYSSQSDTFGREQDRRSMDTIDVMKNRKWKRHIKDENGRSTWETEYFIPTDRENLRFVNDTLSVTYTWGYWIEYFRMSVLEGDECERLDVPMFNDLISNLENLLINLKQCPWYKGCKNIKISDNG